MTKKLQTSDFLNDEVAFMNGYIMKGDAEMAGECAESVASEAFDLNNSLREFPSYSEKKAADRKKMVEILIPLIRATGADVEVDSEWTEWNPSAIMLRVRAGSERQLQLGLELDGKSCQPNVYVLSWCVSTKSDACFSDEFSSVNNCHYQKATDVCEGFAELGWILRRRLTAAANGTAFSEDRRVEYARKTDAGEHLWQRIAKFQEENPGVGLLGNG